jgi:putative ubiquitin-RnfH superfamily antitoxin RatB of RatAB toxin-antitoxin module
MRISIAFAAPTSLWRQTLDLPEGSTVGQAIAASGFSRVFPEFTDHLPDVGVYGERCALGRVLNDQDRVELYRPLVFDPLASRRRRAEHRRDTRKGKLSPP